MSTDPRGPERPGDAAATVAAGNAVRGLDPQPLSEGSPPTPSPSAETFVRGLVDHGLIDLFEASTLRDELFTGTADARRVADALVARGRISPYQASALLDRHGEPLVLDRYVILERIGSGGMGVVYKARHRTLDRIVALKTLTPGEVDTPEKAQRFVREARAAARLEHPNIVAVHDAQSDHGVHFLVMEYIPGETLADLVGRRGPLPAAEAAGLLAQAARGLAHAHGRGIVHRDIKPQNLIRTVEGTVKVLDMGLARLRAEGSPVDATTEPELTRCDAVLGTVSYMAPEQALDPRRADHRADLYALGCTLHFLLTGRAPFPTGSLAEALLAHRDAPIPSLRAVHPEVPEALDDLFRRLVAKRPENRPNSTAAVAEDLENIAAGAAGPPAIEPFESPTHAPTSRRSRRGLVLLGVGAVALAGVVLALWLTSRGSQDTIASTPKSTDPVASTDILGDSRGALTASTTETAGASAVATDPVATDPAASLPGLIPRPFMRPGLGRWQVETLRPRGPTIEVMAASPDGTRIAFCDGTRTIRIINSYTFELISVLLGHTGVVGGIAWNPDGSRLATAAHDGTVRIWSSVDGRPGPLITAHSAGAWGVAWSPDGTRLAACCGDATVRVWMADGREVAVLKGHGAAVAGLAWSPDGRFLLTGSNDGTARLWGVPDGAPGPVIHRDHAGVRAVAWGPGPDGGILALGFTDGAVRLFAPDGSSLASLRIGDGIVCCLAWSPDGRKLAAGGSPGTLHIWDVDDQGVATAGPAFDKQIADVFGVVWLADGHLVSADSWVCTLRWWRPDGSLERTYNAPTEWPRLTNLGLAWAPDGSTLAVAVGQSIRLFGQDGSAGSVAATGGMFFDLAWEPSGKRLAAVSEWSGGWINVFDPKNLSSSRTTWKAGDVGNTCVAWAPDGSTLAVGRMDGRVQLFDAVIGAPGLVLHGHEGRVSALAWSPDSSLLASASIDGTIRLWNATDGRPGPVLHGHEGGVRGLIWDPGGTGITSAGFDGSIRVWSPDGHPMRRIALDTEGAALIRLAASPDGANLAVLTRIGGWLSVPDVCILSIRGETLGLLRGHDAQPAAVAFSPDSRWIATTGSDQTLRLWDATTLQPAWIALALPDGRSALFAPTGERRQGDARALEGDLVYLVETSSGALERLTPAEFDRRAGATSISPHTSAGQGH